MQILNFIKSIFGHIKKDTILEDLDTTKGEFTQVVVPIYQKAVTQFAKQKPKAADFSGLQNIFNRNYKPSDKHQEKNFIAEINKRLPSLIVNLESVEAQVTDVLERDIIKEGLTAKKAVLIRAAEEMSFISQFSVDILDLVLIREAKAHDASTAVELSQGKERDIMDNFDQFARSLAVYSVSPEDFNKSLNDIPDVNLNEKTASSLSGIYADKIDPVNSYMQREFTYNPIYHIRMIYADWQASRYKALREKKRMLELRILNLQMLNEGTNDPAVEKEIEYIKNRVEGIEADMRSIEG